MLINRVDNWPPGYLDPVEMDENCGILVEKRELEKRLAEINNELAEWRVCAERRRRKAWVEYHEANGWPDDPSYKNRMQEGE